MAPMTDPENPSDETLDDAYRPAPGVGERFLTAMSTLAATVTVVSAASPRYGRTGITATAVTSLSTDPPSLVVCVNRSSSLAKALTTTGWFSVNILSVDQESIATDFSGRTQLEGEDRFTSGDWGVHPTGAPILAGAAATCVCHVAGSLNQATHVVVIGTVHDVLLPQNGSLVPLMYHQRQFVRPGTTRPSPS
jgi:flavin reductase (DIM6/NTAB) family NADH-FMN oxidoreductase RutF